MRKLFLYLLFLSIFQSVHAQEKAMDKATDSACRCLTAIKDSVKTSEDFDQKGQACLIKSVIPYLQEISTEENIDLEGLIIKGLEGEDIDGEIGEKLGTRIGINLVVKCPVFLELIAQFDDGEEEEIVTGVISGFVSKVEKDDQLYLYVKESSGKITKLVWLDYFPGADEYKDDPEKLKGKTITANWRMLELYSVKQKDFILCKAITKLVAD